MKKLYILFLCMILCGCANKTSNTETTFRFENETIAVTPGTSSGYEIVVYNTDDKTVPAQLSNGVYTIPEGIEGELQIVLSKEGGVFNFEGDGIGSISVPKEAEESTEIRLNGLTLTSNITAPLTIKKSSTCILNVLENTVKTLTDSADNTDEKYVSGENAVLKSKSDSELTVIGNGELNVIGNAKNGIKANNLTIDSDVVLNITAVSNGIKCDNEFIIMRQEDSHHAMHGGEMNCRTMINPLSPFAKQTLNAHFA